MFLVEPPKAFRSLKHYFFVSAALLTFLARLAHAETIFEENFDSLSLGPSVDEAAIGDAVWTASPLAGWTVDNSKMPRVDGELVGTTEWRGWTFADPQWWASVDDQRRSEFTLGQGVIAIADTDEWDDNNDPSSLGTFESYLITPPIPVSAYVGESLTITFDSTWRPEGNQTGIVSVSYDDGLPQELLRLDSATTSDNETNQSKTLVFEVPAGASTATLSFGMVDAGNNWFWGFDNLVVSTEALPVCPTGLNVRTVVGSGKVELDWTAGKNLEGATLEIRRDGIPIATDLEPSLALFEDIVPNLDPEETSVLEYELRVINAPIDCPALRRRALVSQGSTTKLAQWDFEEGSGNRVNNTVSQDYQGRLVELEGINLVDIEDGLWISDGFLGGAYDFNGEGFIDLGSSIDPLGDRLKSQALRPHASVTIAAWVRPETFTQWAGIAGSVFDTGAAESGFYLCTQEPRHFAFALGTDTEGQLTYLRAEGTQAEWQHLVGVFDGAVHALYLNGNLVASRAATGLIDYEPEPLGFQIGTFSMTTRMGDSPGR